MNYTPGTFNMGAPLSTYHQVPYGHQLSQQPSQQRFNSFAQEKSNFTTQADLTAMLLDQLQKLINTHKKQSHQVNKV